MGEHVTELQAQIIKLFNKGVDRRAIASELGCNYITVCKAIKQHGDIIGQNRDVRSVDISNYESDLSVSLKKLTLHISNLLATKNLQKESSPQLIKTLAIAFDKLRLIEGKATSITQSNVNNISERERAVLGEVIKKYHDAQRTVH